MLRFHQFSCVLDSLCLKGRLLKAVAKPADILSLDYRGHFKKGSNVQKRNESPRKSQGWNSWSLRSFCNRSYFDCQSITSSTLHLSPEKSPFFNDFLGFPGFFKKSVVFTIWIYTVIIQEKTGPRKKVTSRD